MYRRFIKRAIDIMLSLWMLPIFMIILIPVTIAIKLEDKGPIFYTGKRLGKDLKEFPMLKFRSMKVNAPDIRNEDGSTFNSKDDRRLTKIGKILRKSSLDEVPQVINVLKGDMSLIGPRPSPLGNQDKYSKEFLTKFTVRPGVTGYNQVRLRNNATQEEREKNDLFYINNMRLWLDLKILGLTVIKVIRAKNINRND